MAEMTLSGSCLCGAVHYEVTGTPLRFLHCHCARCRKATGTGHATNLILKADSIDWKEAEPSISRYKLPDAERFGTVFCTSCGSLLPREGPEMVVVPAGSLDTAPDIEPQGRIFWSSRASWSCADAALPTFSEYPTG